MIITEPNLEKAKQLIRSSKGEQIIIQSNSPEFNRSILEYGKFDILIFPESKDIQTKKKDKLKQLDTGLNKIIADIAAKNKITIGINLSEINNKTKKEKAIQISRLIEIIKICRKSKTKIKILNYKDKKDAFSLMCSLGASSQQAKEAID